MFFLSARYPENLVSLLGLGVDHLINFWKKKKKKKKKKKNTKKKSLIFWE